MGDRMKRPLAANKRLVRQIYATNILHSYTVADKLIKLIKTCLCGHNGTKEILL